MTEKTEKLFNKGKREITVAGIQFKPGMTVEFSAETAERLKSLYAGEVQSLEDAVKAFDKEADVVAPDPAGAASETDKTVDEAVEEFLSTEDLTYAELQKVLKDAGVEFKSNAKKADLVALVNDLRAADPAAETA